MSLEPGRLVGQAVVFAAVMALIGYFSFFPRYQFAPTSAAQLTVSFSHGGTRLGGCKPFTAAELAKLPPAERAAKVCPRERVPLTLLIELDGRLLLHEVLPPLGIAGDVPSSMHRRIRLEPGVHRLEVRMRDTARSSGFDHELDTTVTVSAGQVRVLDFRLDQGGFVIL